MTSVDSILILGSNFIPTCGIHFATDGISGFPFPGPSTMLRNGHIVLKQNATSLAANHCVLAAERQSRSNEPRQSMHCKKEELNAALLIIRYNCSEREGFLLSVLFVSLARAVTTPMTILHLYGSMAYVLGTLQCILYLDGRRQCDVEKKKKKDKEEEKKRRRLATIIRVRSSFFRMFRLQSHPYIPYPINRLIYAILSVFLQSKSIRIA